VSIAGPSARSGASSSAPGLVARGALEPGQAVLGRGRGQLPPQHARLESGDAGVRVDLDAAHARGPQQQGAVQRPHRGGPVASALSGDAQALLAGHRDGRDDVVRGLGEGHRRGALVGGQVPGLAGLVPRGVGGDYEPAVQPGLKGGERCGGGHAAHLAGVDS
jgi:hypothetical protein